MARIASLCGVCGRTQVLDHEVIAISDMKDALLLQLRDFKKKDK